MDINHACPKAANITVFIFLAGGPELLALADLSDWYASLSKLVLPHAALMPYNPSTRSWLSAYYSYAVSIHTWFTYPRFLTVTDLQGSHLILHLRSANKLPKSATSFMDISDLHFRYSLSQITAPSRQAKFGVRNNLSDAGYDGCIDIRRMSDLERYA